MNNGNNLTVRFTKNLAYTDKGAEDVINYWGSTKEKPGYFVGTDVLFDTLSFGNNVEGLNKCD